MTTLFVSDLHLSQQRPEKLKLFKKLLLGPAIKADAFYILGDLFDDFWIGCDDIRSTNQEIIKILQNYTEKEKVNLYLMRGNRDFHLNKKFAELTGCKIIKDPTNIYLNEEKILLMHGDTLCTDDVKYQYWRKFITNPLIKLFYSKMPLSVRQLIAYGVRGYTTKAIKKKSPEIIDVSDKAVIKAIRDHEVKTLIHGHTHKRAIHHIDIDGLSAKRIVLGDWYKEDWVLIYDKNDFKFQRIADYIKDH